jgi:ABC-type transporter MlaC component/outer membrane protein TolC
MTLARVPLLSLLALPIVIAPPPAGARTLDRRTAIRIAAQQNPQVAAARANEDVVRAQGRQADALRWPEVNLTAATGPSLRATLVPGTADQSVEQQYKNLHLSDLSIGIFGDLTVIQPIWTFGKIAKRQEAAAHGVRARQAQTRMTSADVAFEVAQLYEGYLYARDAESYLVETLHWLERTRESAQERMEANAKNVSERDILRLQAGEALNQIGIDEARAGMAQAQAGLCAYLGFPQSERITFAETEQDAVGRTPDNLAVLVAMAAQHRPELAALREGRLTYDALARAEQAGYLPDIFALGLVSVAYTPGRDWLETRFVVDPLNHFVPALLVGARWQFQGYMSGARAAEQRAQADSLRFTAEWADQGIPAEIRRAYEEIKRTDLDIVNGEEGVSKSRKWLVMAGADYGIGFLDVREVSDAVLSYIALRTALMRARYDHNVAMAAMNKATGTLDGDGDLFYLSPAARAPADERAGGGSGPSAVDAPAVRAAGRLLLAADRADGAGAGAAVSGGEGEGAQGTIRKTVADAFAVLKDPALAKHDKRHQRIAALRQIADRVFDWSEMARGSLGAQWRTLPPAERNKFVEVFKDVLAAQYIDDIDRFQGTEKVTVDGSTREGEDDTVKTTLITASRDRVPIDYRMRREKGDWRVVDISIEGVSLVNHFRKTFSNALANMTVEQLIERLKEQLPPAVKATGSGAGR